MTMFLAMAYVDWAIVAGLALVLFILAAMTKKYTRTVADFLAANRLGGRYLMTICTLATSIAAINIVGRFEMFYEAGFSPVWWEFARIPVMVLVAMTGWVIYRFRETRAMTMGQFFEIRYSKKFRIFTGILAWSSGIVNFGIFPAVGSRFLIYFCDLPTELNILGFAVSTIAVVMFILISVALILTFLGGQIAVMVTDFFQGIFLNVGLLVILGYLLFKFDFSTIAETLKMAPENESLLNPFHTTGIKNFNIYV